MLHVYHKIPEGGGGIKARSGINQRHDLDHAWSVDPSEAPPLPDHLDSLSSAGPTRQELGEDIEAENQAARKTEVLAKREGPQLTEAKIAPDIKHTRERADKAGDSWYTQFAAGARKLSKAAGSLFSKVVLKTSSAVNDNKIARQLVAEAAEFMTSEDKREPKNISADDTPDFKPASATRMAIDSMREIFEGADEATAMLPIEIWNRRDEMAQQARYVLGGGFVAEIYSGIRDKVTGKQAREIEAILAETTNQTKLETPARTWQDELHEGWTEAQRDLGKTKQELALFVTSMPEALKEVGKFGVEGVVDLGRGYGQMFAWMREQYVAAAKSFERTKKRLGEGGQVAIEALNAGAERLRVARTEAEGITEQARLATDSLTNQMYLSREHYLKLIDIAERKLVNNNLRLNDQKLAGQDRTAVKTDMARLERLLDNYEKIIDELDILDGLEARIRNGQDELLEAA